MLIISQNCDFPKKYLKKKKICSHICYGNKKNSNIKKKFLYFKSSLLGT